jgi:hypothetical protein
MVNRSDAALAGVTLALAGTPRRVVFRAEPGRGYRLLYGNPRAALPEYELARVTRAADLEAAAAATVGPGVRNSAWADPAPWTERHPAVLWGALLATMAILGWLAVRALRPGGG